MKHALALCLGLSLLSGCCRAAPCTEAHNTSTVQRQHVLLTTTRLPDTSEAEGVQILIEAAIVTCMAKTIRSLGGKAQGDDTWIFPDQRIGGVQIFDVEENARILQMPSIVTRAGEEAVVEITGDDGTTVTLRAAPTVKEALITVVLDYAHTKPAYTAKATVVVPDRGTAIVAAQ